MADEERSLRTPLSLIIKTITTHAFALASYAYVSNILRRPTRSHIQAIRLLFFLFVPTLPLVELLIDTTRSLLQFLRNYEDDDKIHTRYYMSGALGMHANLSQGDDNKDTKDSSKNLHLLDAGSHCAENHVMPMDWVWIGKILAALFALTQAIGTIVMWVRRMQSYDARPLSFDHRNGAMGVASAICSTTCILILLLRLQWKVSKAFETQQKEPRWAWLGIVRGESSQLVAEALLSMMLHLGIASIPNSDNLWLYTSVGSVRFLLGGSGRIMLYGWQTILLVVFAYIFRHDIARRLGVDNERYTKWFGDKRWRRAKALLGVAIVLWIITDIVWLFVVDVIQVVEEGKGRGVYPDWGYWWQDPISDELIVI